MRGLQRGISGSIMAVSPWSDTSTRISVGLRFSCVTYIHTRLSDAYKPFGVSTNENAPID